MAPAATQQQGPRACGTRDIGISFSPVWGMDFVADAPFSGSPPRSRLRPHWERWPTTRPRSAQRSHFRTAPTRLPAHGCAPGLWTACRRSRPQFRPRQPEPRKHPLTTSIGHTQLRKPQKPPFPPQPQPQRDKPGARLQRDRRLLARRSSPAPHGCADNSPRFGNSCFLRVLTTCDETAIPHREPDDAPVERVDRENRACGPDHEHDG